MFELYTENAKRVIFFARVEASKLGTPEIQATHLLLGLLQQPRAMFARLNFPGARLTEMRKACADAAPRGEPIPTSVDMQLDASSVNILDRAKEERQKHKSKDIDVEHLLLATLYVPSRARDILYQHGLTYEQISADIFKRRVDPPPESALDYT